MRAFLLSLSVVSALLAGGVRADEAASATGPAATQVIPAATVAPVLRQPVEARVPVSGTLVARQQVQVFPQVAGYEITEILVEAGDSVTRGQVLARLDTGTLSAMLAQAEAEYQRALAGVSQAQSSIDSAAASLAEAEAALSRIRQLRSSGSASQAALDQAVAAEANARAASASSADGLGVARASLAQAEASRRIAALNLERAEIVAPVDGLVSARNAELGAISGSAGDPLFVQIADGAIELSAEVIETALSQLSIGAPVEVSVSGIGRIDGTVRLVPAAVDPVTRLGLMRISLDPHPGLRTGLFASGSVITEQREALTVPASAVLSDSDGERVQLVEDGIVRTRPVVAGLIWQGRREIRDGLGDGDRVIARAGAFFRDGDRVREVVADDPPAADRP